MAQLFKGHAVDDGAYPMPEPVRRAVMQPTGGVGQPGSHGQPAQPGGQMSNVDVAAMIDHEKLTAAASDIERIVQAVASLRPAVEQVSDSLRHGAQQQGYTDGIARAQAEVKDQLVEAIAALTAAQQERISIARKNEAALADLAMTIARRVIGAHLERDPELVGRIVHETIVDLEPASSVVIHVNPSDLAGVEANHAELERLVAGPGSVAIVADESVDHGGCLLVSPVGEVDARISTKLAVLETAFAAQRRELIEGPGH